MFMLVNLLAWNMVQSDNDTNENLLEGWSRPKHWDCRNSSFGFITNVKAWLGEWVKGVSQFSKTHSQVLEMNESNTPKWILTLEVGAPQCPKFPWSVQYDVGKSSSRTITFLVQSFELELSYRSQVNLQNCQTHNFAILQFWGCQLPLDFFHFDVIPTINHKETLEEWRQQPHHKLIKI
jgi:hypothetical protein